MKFGIYLNKESVMTKITFSSNAPKLDSKRILDLIRDSMKARPEGYQFMPRYKKHLWDGWISMMERNKFPTGLLSEVIRILDKYKDEYDYDYVIIDDYLIPKIDLSNFTENYFHDHDLLLRDYQIETVKTLITNERGIAHLATNSGKTIIIAALSSLCPAGTFILLHRKELLYQTAEVIEKLTGRHVGLIGDGNFDLTCPITVAMVQSLIRYVDSEEFKNVANTYTMLIIDECHHVSSKSMMEVVAKIDAPYRFGFSGTPMKQKHLPDLQLISMTGEELIRVDNELLINNGYSAKPEIVVYDIMNTDQFIKATYQNAYANLIVNNIGRNNVICHFAIQDYMEKKLVLILVDQLDHQSNIVSSIIHMIGRNNVTALNGSQSTDYRNSNIAKMREGDPHVYVVTNIFDEGVDVPSVDVLILAGGGKSHIKILQRVGRGMRKKDGDNKLKVIDFYDTGNKHLEHHSKMRLDIYKSEGFEIKLYSDMIP